MGNNVANQRAKDKTMPHPLEELAVPSNAAEYPRFIHNDMFYEGLLVCAELLQRRSEALLRFAKEGGKADPSRDAYQLASEELTIAAAQLTLTVERARLPNRELEQWRELGKTLCSTVGITGVEADISTTATVFDALLNAMDQHTLEHVDEELCANGLKKKSKQ